MTPRAAVSSVAAIVPAASATSSSSEAGEAVRLVPGDDGVKEEEELMLPFGQPLDRSAVMRGDVVLLLAPDDCCGMLPRGGQMRAVGRTVDLDEALGSAADRADRLPSAGQSRRALRCRQSGQVMSAASHTVAYDSWSRNGQTPFERNGLMQPAGSAGWLSQPCVRSESPTEFFRERVECAMQRQRVTVQRSSPPSTSSTCSRDSSASITRRAAGDDEPLGIRLAEALQTAGTAQRDGLKEVGDLSLFISGFFSDSLNRRLVDVDYYIQLGECAYGSLARRGDPDTFGDVFDELSEKFGAVVDVLGDVSARTGLTSDTDLLRLYDTWVRTRSQRSGELLAARGIVPNRSIRNRFVQ